MNWLGCGHATCRFDLQLVNNVEPSRGWDPKFVDPVLFQYESQVEERCGVWGASNELQDIDEQVICPSVVWF